MERNALSFFFEICYHKRPKQRGGRMNMLPKGILKKFVLVKNSILEGTIVFLSRNKKTTDEKVDVPQIPNQTDLVKQSPIARLFEDEPGIGIIEPQKRAKTVLEKQSPIARLFEDEPGIGMIKPQKQVKTVLEVLEPDFKFQRYKVAPMELIEEMALIYETHTHDWLGSGITKQNKLDFYNIQKGFYIPTVDNGALLTEENCLKLEQLRFYYPELYSEFQYLFQIANDMKCPIVSELEKLLHGTKERMDQALEQKTEKYPRYVR